MRARRIIFLSVVIIIFFLFNLYITKKRALSYFLENILPNQHGLTGFYFLNTEKFNNPVLIRIDPAVCFNKDTLPFYQKDYISIRWAGLIYIQKTGSYTIGTQSDDSSWVFIDHKKIVDNSGVHPKTKKSKRIFLTKGRHTIEVDYNQYSGEACIELIWRPPGGVKEIIPKDVLTPVSGKFDINKTDRLYMDMMRLNLLAILLSCIPLITKSLNYNNIGYFYKSSLTITSLPIIFIILLGAYLRLGNIGLMEFKGDESTALFIAKELVTFRYIPLVGLMSSIGAFNPPFFIYLLTIPFIISQNPLFITSLIAVANIAAICLCYIIGKNFHSRTCGIVSSALFSVSPWAIIYSRKIWAQDLLPVFTTLLFYLVMCWVAKREKKRISLILILLTCVLQLHYSAPAFILLLLLIYILLRPSVDMKSMLRGLLISFLLFCPFIIFQIKNDFQDIFQIINTGGTFSVQKLFSSFIGMFASALDKINFGNFSYLIGIDEQKLYRPYIYAFAVLEKYAFVAALIYTGIRVKKNSFYLISFLWFTIPIIVWAVFGIPPHPHYTLILYPIQFIIIGIFFSDIYKGLAKPFIILFVIFIMFTQSLYTINLYSLIKLHGSGYGDACFGYGFKRDAVRHILDTAKEDNFIVSSTGIEDSPKPNFSSESLHPEYWYLLWLYQKKEKAEGNKTYYFLISSSENIPAKLKYLEYINSRLFGFWWVHTFLFLN